MKPKCLITGSNGFIARNIIKRISAQYDIIHFRRPMFPQDLTVQADVVIHCAGELYNESEMFESNVQLTYELLQYALKNRCKKFIYLGSSSEYGRVTSGSPEWRRINPTTMYEATKGCGTLLVQAFCRQYGLQGVIVRPYTIYGPYENPRKLIPTIFNSYKKKIPLNLVTSPAHDWAYIEDFVSGIENLLNSLCTPGDIINFGTGVQTTNLGVLTTLEMILGTEIPFTEAGSLRSYDSECWVCDTTYARAMYGIEFKTSLYQGLEKYIQWMQKFYN